MYDTLDKVIPRDSLPCKLSLDIHYLILAEFNFTDTGCKSYRFNPPKHHRLTRYSYCLHWALLLGRAHYKQPLCRWQHSRESLPTCHPWAAMGSPKLAQPLTLAPTHQLPNRHKSPNHPGTYKHNTRFSHWGKFLENKQIIFRTYALSHWNNNSANTILSYLSARSKPCWLQCEQRGLENQLLLNIQVTW